MVQATRPLQMAHLRSTGEWAESLKDVRPMVVTALKIEPIALELANTWLQALDFEPLNGSTPRAY